MMNCLFVDWLIAKDGRAYVVLVRDGVRQEMWLTGEEIKALEVDYDNTLISVKLAMPPELEQLSRRVMRRARKSKSARARR